MNIKKEGKNKYQSNKKDKKDLRSNLILEDIR